MRENRERGEGTTGQNAASHGTAVWAKRACGGHFRKDIGVGLKDSRSAHNQGQASYYTAAPPVPL
eukprot:scaffold19923_cov107-Isochrysis_galbana.AAC.6